jgi:hypothetical protein
MPEVTNLIITQEELDTFDKNVNIINRVVNRIHEHASPKFTSEERIAMNIQNEYGGITGTIRPSGLKRIAKVLCSTLDDKYLMKRGESVFCDIGSGTGRPTFYFATLPIKASIGFDIDPWQVFNSVNAQTLLRKTKQSAELMKATTTFFPGDVLGLRSLEPVTHAFAFLGYPDIVHSTANLIANTKTIKVFIAVVLHDRELRSAGVIEESESEEYTVLRGMQMPGGNSYTAYVIPMTPVRRKTILKATKAKAEKAATECILDFKKVVLDSYEDDQLSLKIINQRIQKDEGGGKTRASRRKAKNESTSTTTVATTVVTSSSRRKAKTET